MRKPLDTVDLSFLTDTGERKFEKAFKLGKEEGFLSIRYNPDIPLLKRLLNNRNPNSWGIHIEYRGPVKPPPVSGGQLKQRMFFKVYGLSTVPASLPRALVRLGASEAFMRFLAETYAEILLAVRPIEHGDLHTDTGAEY